MGSIPLAALSVNQNQPSPLEEYAKIMQIRGQQAQQQTQDLQQTGLSQQNQMQALQLKDAQTLRSLSPQFLQKDDKGNVTGYDFKGLIGAASGAGVSPQTLQKMQMDQLDLTQKYAATDEATRNDALAKNKTAYDVLEGVRSQKDPAARQSAYQQGLQQLQKVGVDTSKYPPQAPSDDDLNSFEAGLGVHQQILADAKTQAETGESAAKAANETAQAALANIKVNLSKNSKPGDFDAQIDKLAAPTDPLNIQTKTMVNSALQRGDYEGATKALDSANQALIQRQQTQYVQNAENVRQSLNRQATFANTMQKDGLDQVGKMFTDPQHGYTQFLSQAEATKSAVANAKNGNELASSLAPLMTASGVLSFSGIHRINQVDVNQAGPQVGSIYRRINSALDKAGSGTINPDTAKEMDSLMDELIEAKHTALVNGAQVIAKNAGLDPTKTTIMGKDGTPDTLDHASKNTKAPAAAAEVPDAVTKALANVGPGIHTLSDGSKWMKDENGTVTKQ